MAKYHLTDNGPKVCIASPGNCRYRIAGDEHYDDYTRANNVYLNRLQEEYTAPVFGMRSASTVPAADGGTGNVDNANSGDVANAVNDILGHSSNFRFSNKSNADGDYVSLDDLSDPVAAGNNCFVTTNVLNDWLKRRGHAGFIEVEIVSEKGSHWALRNGDMIVDFTFRQFDPDCEFPVVLNEVEWRSRVESFLGVSVSMSSVYQQG